MPAGRNALSSQVHEGWRGRVELKQNGGNNRNRKGRSVRVFSSSTTSGWCIHRTYLTKAPDSRHSKRGGLPDTSSSTVLVTVGFAFEGATLLATLLMIGISLQQYIANSLPRTDQCSVACSAVGAYTWQASFYGLPAYTL